MPLSLTDLALIEVISRELVFTGMDLTSHALKRGKNALMVEDAQQFIGQTVLHLTRVLCSFQGETKARETLRLAVEAGVHAWKIDPPAETSTLIRPDDPQGK